MTTWCRPSHIRILCTPVGERRQRECASASAILAQPSRIDSLFAKEEQSGLTTAIVDPYVNAVHVSLLKPLPDANSEEEALRQRGDRLLVEGPLHLTSGETLEVLSDPDLMLHLHRSVWANLAGTGTNWWRAHVERYRITEWAREHLGPQS